MNPFSEIERLDMMMAACVAAVAEHFSHIAICDILEPPHQWFDAALARQLALHLLISAFEVPKRRVVAMQRRSREAINRGLRTIDSRRACPVFDQQYETMVERAQTLLAEQFALAA